ncbi:GntR family transcriptional regulator [Ferviditalea candida]|uniref:GntR family transcriptional regulator n=1 Tax=Ferviditalea candida TaxID=3108399 RepID=A0ABU5ZQ56_9BACL|nr:GntR family transcriptional regulator [Paenibacillaceae bacterium T2]
MVDVGNKLNLVLEDKDTLHLKVTRVIRNAILRGEFQPGERLVQEELAQALKVSRMPVREALHKLESEGLVILEPHRGAIVKKVDVEDLDEIYYLRSQLEKMAVELSVPRMTLDDIAKLEELLQRMEGIDDVERFVEANIEFHKLLVKYCAWKRLLNFIETLWNGLPQQTPHFLEGQLEISNREHREIVEAVKVKDSAKAGQLLSEHILRTGRELMKKIRLKGSI